MINIDVNLVGVFDVLYEECNVTRAAARLAYLDLGDQRRAQEHLEKAVPSSPYARQFNTTQYLFDVRTVSLANSHWFSGNLDQATRYAEMTIEQAERSADPRPQCRALMWAMP